MAFTAVAALVVMLNHDGGFDHAAWLAYTASSSASASARTGTGASGSPSTGSAATGSCWAPACWRSRSRRSSRTIPLLAETFRATPLEPSDWAIVAVVAFAPALLAEVVRTVRGGRTVWVA